MNEDIVGLLKILLVIIVLVLGRKLFQRHQQKGAPLGTRWLNFWTFFVLPIGAFTDFSQALSINPPWGIVCACTSIVIRVGLIFGLCSRKGWAWKWNWVLIVLVWLSPVPQNFNSTDEFWVTYIAKIIGFGLVWMLPNYVYWKKRRVLFSGGSHRIEDQTMSESEVSEMPKDVDEQLKAGASSDIPSEPLRKMVTKELLDIEADKQVESKKSKIEPVQDVIVTSPQPQRAMGWKPNIPQRIIFVILTLILLGIAGETSHEEEGLVVVCLSAAAISAAISVHKISNPFKRKL